MLQVVREGVVRGRVLWVVVVYVVAGCGEGVVGDRVLWVLCTVYCVLWGGGCDGWVVVGNSGVWGGCGRNRGVRKTRVMCCVMLCGEEVGDRVL